MKPKYVLAGIAFLLSIAALVPAVLGSLHLYQYGSGMTRGREWKFVWFFAICFAMSAAFSFAGAKIARRDRSYRFSLAQLLGVMTMIALAIGFAAYAARK